MSHPDEAAYRSTINGWKIYSNCLTCLLLIALFSPSWSCIDRGRNEGIESTAQLLKLAGKRDFNAMSRIASPGVVNFMKERDARWGKVLKYSLQASVVQVGGTPSQIRFRVWRERRNVEEEFTCMGPRVVYGFVVWPEAEEK